MVLVLDADAQHDVVPPGRLGQHGAEPGRHRVGVDDDRQVGASPRVDGETRQRL